MFFSAVWDFLTTSANWHGAGGIPQRTLDHLEYSGIALAIAILIGLPVELLIVTPPCTSWMSRLEIATLLALATFTPRPSPTPVPEMLSPARLMLPPPWMITATAWLGSTFTCRLLNVRP